MSAQRDPAAPAPARRGPKAAALLPLPVGPQSRSYCHPQATPKEKSPGTEKLGP